MSIREKNEQFRRTLPVWRYLYLCKLDEDLEKAIADKLGLASKPFVTTVNNAYWAYISQDELDKHRQSDFLSMLRGHGVDNWEGYGEACREYAEKYPDESE